MTQPAPPSAAADLEEFERELLVQAGRLLPVARRLTRSAAEAEDLVQDTLVKALRARDQYEEGTNLRAWLLRILKNTFINRYRRGGLERSVTGGPDAEPLVDGWVGAATLRALRDPEGQALAPALEREIVRALDALPEEFRVVVLLADVEELSYREIAEVVGCPIGTVMSRLHRGRRLLQVSLVDQAREFGLLPAAAPAPEGTPIPIDAYRARRAGR